VRTSTNPDLEARIHANPDDRDDYLVYGDWLSEQGDPRGELITVQVKLEDAPDDAALRATGVPVPRLARGGMERFSLAVVPGSPVGAEDAALPEALALALAGPNPVRTATRLRVALPAATHVAVTVVDALGRQVARLADGAMAAGTHTVSWDAERLAAGVYVVRMQAGRDVRTVRVVVAR